MGRSQKYFARPRVLYALVFASTGHVYIGQSVDAKKRQRQHELPSGGWCGQAFSMVELGVYECTQAQAEDLEYAWRWKAAQAGWEIYGKPPNIVVSPYKRMTPSRRLLAFRLTWPRELRRGIIWWPWILAGGALVASLHYAGIA